MNVHVPAAALSLLCLIACGHAEPPKPYTEKIPGTDVAFEMVHIPGGTFKMGSPPTEKDRREDEGPQVEVKVEPFYVGKFEVTWAEYEAFTDNYFRVFREGPPRIPA